MADQLVRGVTLRQGASAMERVELRNLRMDLLATWDGTEVIRQFFPKGTDFGLRPQEGWSALECLYILEGEALWSTDERTIRLGPGDSLIGTPVQEPCILRTKTDLIALYVCSQPTFHEISGQVTYLQQLAISVEKKDGYTKDHCGRIQDLAVAVGKRLGLTPERQYNLLHGAFLHDVGKVGIPDEILLKPGKLTPEEWQIMQQHPTIGSRMLADSVVAPAAPIVAQHHERFDGSGYPLGLKGEAISLEARIVAVVDSFDAMTTDRVYRPGMPVAAALSDLQRNAGTLYDPAVVQQFIEVIEESPHYRPQAI